VPGRIDVGKAVNRETNAGDLKIVVPFERRRQFPLHLPAKVIFDRVSKVDNPWHRKTSLSFNFASIFGSAAPSAPRG
jgi:hypothetical protein